MKKCTTFTLGQTTIKKVPDYDADASYLGEYGDKLKPGCIIRADEKFYEDIPEDNEDEDGYTIYEIPKIRGEYTFFYPSDTGEKIGTEDYRKYALQNFHAMESLNNGDWMYIGIIVSTMINTDMNVSSDISDALWGIEDTWDKKSNEYHKEIIDELKCGVKHQLKEMGFSDDNIEESFKTAKMEGF